MCTRVLYCSWISMRLNLKAFNYLDHYTHSVKKRGAWQLVTPSVLVQQLFTSLVSGNSLLLHFELINMIFLEPSFFQISSGTYLNASVGSPVFYLVNRCLVCFSCKVEVPAIPAQWQREGKSHEVYETWSPSSTKVKIGSENCRETTRSITRGFWSKSWIKLDYRLA